MEQLKCSGCGEPLIEGDRFCGICGTPVAVAQHPAPWPGATQTEGGGLAEEPETRDPGPFFGHAPRQPPEGLSNATRYLCAAAYLDRSFANRVIQELVASNRAVVKSVNFDLGPIVRHCLQARKNIMVRDILLLAFMVLGFILNPLTTFSFLLLALILGVLLPHAKWRRRKLGGKLLIAFLAVTALSVVGTIFVLLAVGTLFTTLVASGSLATAITREFGIVATFAILFAVTGATQFGFMYTTLRTLSERLRPGAAAPRPVNSRAEARIATIEAAQWGNLTLYGTENPFIGAGPQAKRSWSIAIELDRARPIRRDITARPPARGYVPIDPVELHEAIRGRLLKLNDPGLPYNERVSALAVDDHVVGSGLLKWSSPLLDMVLKTPYSQVSAEAIDALIHHPQAGLRYYQRVSVGDEGPPVMSGRWQVIDGVDQGTAVSTFVYAAVEGRMFYLEFVRTALPPINRDYQIIDLLPAVSSGRFRAAVVTQTLKSMFTAIIYSPAGIYAAFRLARKERRLEADAKSSDGYVFGSFGALESVRELGAADYFDTYIQELDVEKYTKIIERLLLDTVQDFLEEKGVDTSAFANSARSIINGNVVSADNISGGQFSFGSGDNVSSPASQPG